MTDSQLVKVMCTLCQNNLQTCKYSYLARQKKICKHFSPKYNCEACCESEQCIDAGMLCYKFLPKELVLESDKAHPIQSEIQDFLMELMKVEKSTHQAIVSFKQRLETNGILASLFAEKNLMRYIDNLVALYALKELLDKYGLGEFKTKILNNEIDRIFNPNPIKLMKPKKS